MEYFTNYAKLNGIPDTWTLQSTIIFNLYILLFSEQQMYPTCLGNIKDWFLDSKRGKLWVAFTPSSYWKKQILRCATTILPRRRPRISFCNVQLTKKKGQNWNWRRGNWVSNSNVTQSWDELRNQIRALYWSDHIKLTSTAPDVAQKTIKVERAKTKIIITKTKVRYDEILALVS